MKISIIGGGIGGLTLALMLKARGMAVQVFESAAQVRPLGVGINVQPSAIVELAALGLLPQLDALGVRTAEVCYFNRHGQRIWSEPRGLAAGYRVPQFSIHRGELQMLLMQTALERLGPQAVHCGQEAVAVDPDSASVTLLDRDSGRTRVERADAVISADGIHSAVRRQFYPNEGPPRYSGRVLWRATTVGKPFLTGASMVMAGHADQKLVTYPISRRHADQGESLINWIAELKVPGDTPPKSDWNKEVALDVFAGPFEAWRWDWLDVPALFRGASTYYEFPMVDRDPLPQWSYGRITLAGDAAHPMYPIGSNGATQGIIDARVLALHLATEPDPVRALARYDEARREPTARIVLGNRAGGPDKVLELARQRAPDPALADLDAVLPQAERAAIAADYKQLAGFDPAALNARASHSAIPGATAAS